MLGFSLQKLVVLVAVIAAVWYGFKFIGRLDQARKASERRVAGAARARRAATGQAAPRDLDAEDMVRCDACGAYVAQNGVVSCGRDDCPYPG